MFSIGQQQYQGKGGLIRVLKQLKNKKKSKNQ
jgi:hypothetical protein